MTLLTPHTSEWFEALARIDPAKAAHAGDMVRLSGKTEICSVCGDGQATDYKLDEVILDNGSPMTTRLCLDCAMLRAGHLGEVLTKI